MAAVEQLLAREFFGIKLGLENMRALAAALGHPERAYATTIVAGTNGKGSVTAMVERALHAAGHRTGRYTSPHLVRLEERFAIDGEPISSDRLEAAVAHVLAVEDSLRAAGTLAHPATFFELATAAAFELFRRERVDIAVVEVGLGGRFDATNIVMPMAAAITSIDFDHTRHLGRTIPEIAFEKAGVIKPGIPVVTGDLTADAEAVVQQVCAEQQARLVPAHEGVETPGEVIDGGARLTIETATRAYGPLTLALAGRHQIGNAVVAVRLLEELDALGLHVPAEAVARGLETVRWRARLERVRLSDGRTLLLDAAHNPAGAAALASYLREVWPAGVVLVFGAMADKDIDGMLAALAPAARDIIVTQVEGERAATLDALATAARAHFTGPSTASSASSPSSAAGGRVRAIADPRQAIDAALAAGPVVCVAGSIFLLGGVLSHVDGLA
jgi:dihydrofolate synthase/folylpolyglutamate synthase